MIIVNLKGGLGNQMFQYAMGRKLSLKNDDELKLEIDGLERANAQGNIYRPFSLSRFNIIKNIAIPEEVQKIKYPLGMLSKIQRWINFRILKKTNSFWDPAALERTGNIFLDGYWQSPKYFEDIRETLLAEFILTEPLQGYGKDIVSQMENIASVSIHVRRGDYVKNPRVTKEFGICSVSYYRTAIGKIEEVYPEVTYFVFSDDIEWVKKNIDITDKAVFVKDPSLSDTEELFLMSKCKHNIIANSTFSWWAAWLNQNSDKMVIAPDPWFNTKPSDPYLIPDSWIQIPKN